MAEESPFDYLSSIGDYNDDLDSLFGGDDDTELASLLMEAISAEPPQELEPNCEPASSSWQQSHQQAANHAAQLCFLEVHAQRAQSNRHPAPSVPQLHLPAVPDPLNASLSHRDGHTSGDLVVSIQDPTSSASGFSSTAASSEEVPDDGALEAELEGLWEAVTSDDQPVNTDSGNQGANVAQNGDVSDDDNFINPAQIPGFRYANCESNSAIRLPRRIDHDSKLAGDLMYYITLNRNTRMEVLYQQLELDIGEGKRLGKEMRTLLKQPPLVQLVEQPHMLRPSDTKRLLIKMALYMLISKDWGTAWFGDGCKTAASRTLFWPTDSSVILAGFVMFLYRMYNGQRQMHQCTLRHARRQNSDADPDPWASPSRPASTPLSVASSIPPSGQSITSSQSPSPTPDGLSFFNALAMEASAVKKRKRNQSVAPLADDPDSYIIDVPANARLKYHVYVKDADDGSDLAPPTTYRHTDYMISRGAFASLKSSFEVAGHTPIFEIQTPLGRKKITSEEGWDQAVASIYNMRRSGGVVEVDVLV